MAIQLFTNSISLKQKQTEAVNLLQSWMDDEDELEQQEALLGLRLSGVNEHD
jgi:hypothetical protein